MRISVLFCLFTSSILSAQGNLGVNFGLNDDNFGSIENIKTKVDDYNLDLKNSTGFQLGVFTEIDLIQRGSIENNGLAYDVNLEINGIECEFLLDSGAMSFTDGKLMYERLKKAGVKYTDLNNIESVFGVGGEALTNTVIFDEIKIGDYIVKNVVAILTAIKNFSFSIWPISPVSTIPTSGMAKFEKKMGIESLNICHFVILTVNLIAAI